MPRKTPRPLIKPGVEPKLLLRGILHSLYIQKELNVHIKNTLLYNKQRINGKM